MLSIYDAGQSSTDRKKPILIVTTKADMQGFLLSCGEELFKLYPTVVTSAAANTGMDEVGKTVK